MRLHLSACNIKNVAVMAKMKENERNRKNMETSRCRRTAEDVRLLYSFLLTKILEMLLVYCYYSKPLV